MKQYKVKIKANPAYPFYMQHRMDDVSLEAWEKKRGKIIERSDISKEDQVRAEFHAYISADGKFYIPAEHIRGSLIIAGHYMKAKVGNVRKNMSNIVAGMFYVSPDELPLKQDYLIDKRSAVNRNVKGRIISIRPKWKDWETEFILEIDNDTITPETIRELITIAGNYVGIGSFRPDHKGQFGRFIIESFEEII
jgi:hypothetical protein